MGHIRKTSMQDIADYLGVSKNCVSLALNNRKGVSEATRARILQAAKDLDYAGLGKALSQQQAAKILVVLPEYVMTDRIFYHEFIWDIEKIARAAGYYTLIVDISTEMEQTLTLPSAVFDSEHCGALLLGVLSRPYVNKLTAALRPVVFVDTYYHDMAGTAVVTENIHGAYMAAKHLISYGHRDIGFIGPIHLTSSNYERWMGFCKAMADENLPVNEQYCLLESSDFSSTDREIESFIAQLKEFPTAFFCANDRMAISLIHVLSSRGFSVPDDVSVIGFDDAEVSRLVLPKLTTIRVKRKVISQTAVDLLLTSAKSEDGRDGVKVAIYGELVIRDSVRQLPH